MTPTPLQQGKNCPTKVDGRQYNGLENGLRLNKETEPYSKDYTSPNICQSKALSTL